MKLHFRRISRGPNKGQVRFARANDKRVKFDRTSAAHTIRIPARPYLFQRDGDIPDDWQGAIVGIVKRHLGLTMPSLTEVRDAAVALLRTVHAGPPPRRGVLR